MSRTTRDTALELAIGRILWAGVTASSLCLAVGLALSFVPGADAAARLLLNAGLIVLLATPAGRVVTSVAEYAIERDWIFFALTLVVLGELAAGVFAATR